ncbi:MULTISPECIES: DinB family protein [Flavobacterium]|uniref:DinB family protein n=1 Tax=Flavobacterium jumunjinense TaxID=998845 RepID=A0ABV5GQY6_9FLAO|nr:MULTISPECIES: DinB family protein [Flavobacterium]
MKYFIIILSVISFANVFAQDEPISAFLEKWENSKKYLLELAEAMPEDKYNFKPTEREMDFGEQLLHIKVNMDWLSTSYFGAEKIEKPKEASTYTKAEIITFLETSFNAVSKAIETTKPKSLKEKVDFFAGPKTKLQILNLLQDHVTHHRGQIIVYLNLNEIKPPKYVGW